MSIPEIPQHSVIKLKSLTKDELKHLPTEDLVLRITQLESQVSQLKNIINKFNSKPMKCKKRGRVFDFSKHPTMNIALKVLYLGWDYQGLAAQDDTNQTIEHHLMEALMTCCLIENRLSANYSRCGRTDKGVSAFCQVVSLTVRKSVNEGQDLEYCKMLNRLLPKDIRVISWAEVPLGWSARFDCSNRTYKYFFPKADLDIDAMNMAANLLVGTHDFRNLCKMDVGNGVTNFIRTVYEAEVKLLSPLDRMFENGRVPSYLPKIVFHLDSYQMCELRIKSKSFLWHQVRCIVAILLLVGQKLEAPSVVISLLDVENTPRKPQYPLASDLGLNLFYAEFNEEPVWQIDTKELETVVLNLQEIWTNHAIRSMQAWSMLQELHPLLSKQVNNQADVLLRKESKSYKPLFLRQTCHSLEDQIEHYVKKKRIKPPSRTESQ